MTSLKTSYGELIALTQLYLLRECDGIKNLTVSPDTLLHYQKLNFPQNKTESRPHLPQQTILTKAPIETNSTPPRPQTPLPATAAPLQVKEPAKTTTPFPPSYPVPPKLPQPQLQENPAPAEKTTSLPGSKTVALSTLAPYNGPPAQFKEIWTFFQTHLHQIALEDVIPDDLTAKRNKNRWQEAETIPPILILSFDEGVKSLAFLKNIANAITSRLAPARVINAPKIENEKQWGTLLNTQGLKLIIASDYGLYLQPLLMQFHQENPQEGKHFLNHIPLLLLSDLEFYFKNGKMKAYLWRAICTEFAAMRGK